MNSVSMLKKLVLLMDVDSETRESRAKAMRNLGVTVHCASTARGARVKLEANAYDLILVDFGADSESADAWVRQIRENNPRQLVAFLVGSPMFVATSRDGKLARSASARKATRPGTVPKATSPRRAFDFGQQIKDAEANEAA